MLQKFPFNRGNTIINPTQSSHAKSYQILFPLRQT
jgi:hypothetical protein